MKQNEFEQLKEKLEETFTEKPSYKSIWYLMGYITGNVGTEFRR